MQPKQVKIKLYLENIEVPVISAAIKYGIDNIANADIEIVPTELSQSILPRTLVNLFFYDEMDPDTNEYKKWKCLFVGEVTGIGISTHLGQKHTVLYCSDFFNYFNNVFQYQLRWGQGTIDTGDGFADSGTGGLHNIPSAGIDSFIYQLTQSTGEIEGFPDIDKGSLLSVVLRLIMKFKVLITDTAGKFDRNTFYSKADARLVLSSQIGAVPEDSTASKLIPIETYGKWIGNQLDQGGGLMSLAQVIQSILRLIYHHYVPSPSPFYHKVKDKFQRLQTMLFIPEMFFMAPPMCNVIFPEYTVAYNFQRNFLQEITRLQAKVQPSLLIGSKHPPEFWTTKITAPKKLITQQKYDEFGIELYTEYDHERFTGIIPGYAVISQLAIAAKSTAKTPIPLLNDLADYEFYKQRLSARTMDVNCIFNPWIVVGAPALVINKNTTGNVSGRHYLGYVSAISHIITKTSASTNVGMIMVHHPDEDIATGSPITERKGLETSIDVLAWPTWTSDIYDINSIGPKVYKELWGVNSIVSPENDGSLIGVINHAIGSYFKVINVDSSIRAEYIYNIIKRPIATKFDIGAFFKETFESDEKVVLERKAVIISYIKDLKENLAFLGSS